MLLSSEVEMVTLQCFQEHMPVTLHTCHYIYLKDELMNNIQLSTKCHV